MILATLHLDMKRIYADLRWIKLCTLSICISSYICAEEPLVSREDIKIIQSLPYGIADHPTSILRSKHIKSVTYVQSGRKSRYGFSYGDNGIINQALWVRTQSSGKTIWGFRAEFKEPLVGNQFNSLVLWLRATDPGVKFWVSAEDRTKKQDAHTDLIPSATFKSNTLYQLTIPFSVLRSDKPFNPSAITTIGIYFDLFPSGEMVDIVGLALSQQSSAMRYVHYQVVEPEKPERETPNAVEDSPKPKLQNLPERTVTPVVIPETSKPRTKFDFVSFAKFLLTVTSIGFVIAGLILIFRRKKKPEPALIPSLSRSKILMRMPWPDNALFWELAAMEGCKFAWLPLCDSEIEIKQTDLFSGESFFYEKQELAKNFNISLIPSLGFIKVDFQNQLFFSNPHLYVFKPVTGFENNLSDQELNTLHVGYSTVWIPPYWQKKHQLPQRVLVAHGRLPGMLSMTNTLQYNMGSPTFFEYVVTTLNRFAARCDGIRIENAEFLLTSNIQRYWPDHASANHKEEFWQQVLSSVRLENSSVKFYAESSSASFSDLLKVGFDYVENKEVRDQLILNIERESVAEDSKIRRFHQNELKTSVYPLFDMTKEQPESLSLEQKILANKILALFPGVIEPTDNIPVSLAKFLSFIGEKKIFWDGQFALLQNSVPEIFSFCRWHSDTLAIVVANFSHQQRSTALYFNGLASEFAPTKMYLFNDALYGYEKTSESRENASDQPVLAMMGRDIAENGLSVTLTGLSLRVFSCSLAKPIVYDASSKIRQFHQT